MAAMLCQWQSEPAVPVAAYSRHLLEPNIPPTAPSRSRPAFAVRSAQGRRSYQEDNFNVCIDLLGCSPLAGEASHHLPGVHRTPEPRGATRPAQQQGEASSSAFQQGPPTLSFAAVFDGHGGSAVAQHCAERLAPILRSHLLHHWHSSGSSGGSSGSEDGSDGGAALASPASDRPSGSPVQQLCWGDGYVQDQVLSEALVRSFEDCDASIPQALSSDGGSTAVCAVVGPDAIWVANCGDSRAMVARKGALAVPLSDDHKPERPDETERVKAAGGHVFWNGGHRVMGVLSMTRAMGDQYLKQYGVICTPEVMRVERTHDDEFLLLASDGLWAALSNAEAVGVAAACLERAQARGADRAGALRVAAQVLVKAALQQGSSDNITVVLMDLKQPQTALAPPRQQQHACHRQPSSAPPPEPPQGTWAGPSAALAPCASGLAVPAGEGAAPVLLLPHAGRHASHPPMPQATAPPALAEPPTAPVEQQQQHPEQGPGTASVADPQGDPEAPAHHVDMLPLPSPPHAADPRAHGPPSLAPLGSQQGDRQAGSACYASGATASQVPQLASPLETAVQAGTATPENLGVKGLVAGASSPLTPSAYLVTACLHGVLAFPGIPMLHPQLPHCGWVADAGQCSSPAGPVCDWGASPVVVSTGAAPSPCKQVAAQQHGPGPTLTTTSSAFPLAPSPLLTVTTATPGVTAHAHQTQRRSDGSMVVTATTAMDDLSVWPASLSASGGSLPTGFDASLLMLGKRCSSDNPALADTPPCWTPQGSKEHPPPGHPPPPASATSASLHHGLEFSCESPRKRSRLFEPPMSPSPQGFASVTTGVPGTGNMGHLEPVPWAKAGTPGASGDDWPKSAPAL